MDRIDSMKDAAILRFDAPRDMDASVEQMLFVVGGKLLDVGDERLRLFFGYRTTRLDGIDTILSNARAGSGAAVIGLPITRWLAPLSKAWRGVAIRL